MPRKKSFITVTDQFCGAGGSSQGARALSERMGGGLEVQLALNHWKLAIETHQHNFPNTLHECTDISACDPRRYPSSDVLITSPECTNHSLAKGKKIVKAQLGLYDSGKLDAAAERSRATMFDVCRFAEYHSYNLIIVENVVDARKWVMFDAWLMAMHALGYDHQCVYLNSMHCHPTPQSRDRMYVVFWKKKNPKPNLNITPAAFCPKCAENVSAVQTWKNPKVRYGKYRQQYVYSCPRCAITVEPYYYAAFNAIDWSIKSERIGDRIKPLADSTMGRVRYGLKKYGPNPLVITTRYTSGLDCRVKEALRSALGTQPGDVSHGILNQPFFTYTEHTKANNGMHVSSSFGPTRTQTATQAAGIVVPAYLISKPYGHKEQMKASGIHEEAYTQPADARHSLVQMPFIAQNNNNGTNRDLLQSLCTVTAGGLHHGLVTEDSFASFIGYYYKQMQASLPTDALGACKTHDTHFQITYKPGEVKVEDCFYRMLRSGEIGCAMAFLDGYIVKGGEKDRVKQYGNAVTPPAMELLLERAIETLK